MGGHVMGGCREGVHMMGGCRDGCGCDGRV